MKRLFTVLLCLFALTLSGVAQPPKAAAKKSAAPAPPDKAYLQKIWDGWSTLDPANVAQFYASGPHMFFDIAPLKYEQLGRICKGSEGRARRLRQREVLGERRRRHPSPRRPGLGHGNGEERD